MRRRVEPRWIVLLFAPALLAGCGASLSDFSVQDARWFSGQSRIFNRSLSIETPPLTPTAAITPNDLISADGQCPGMTAPADANALSDGNAAAPPPVTGSVALGHTECDVARGIGAPDRVEISNDPGGQRVVVLTYIHGARAGVYTFRGGRLSIVDAAPAPEAPARPAKRNRRAG